MGAAAAVLAIAGAVILACSGRAAKGSVRAQAVLLDITLGEAAGHVKPVVELALNGIPRRAVCNEMPRNKLNARAGDVVGVIYKPRGANGFSGLYIDSDGSALRSRVNMMRFSGALLMTVGAVFGVLAAVIG